MVRAGWCFSVVMSMEHPVGNCLHAEKASRRRSRPKMTPADASRQSSDELERLVKVYRHLREEHRRVRANSSAHRRLERKLAAAGARFERRLRQTTLSEDERSEWRRHQTLSGAPPRPPTGTTPAMFRVDVDGVVAERFANADEFLTTSPHQSFPAGNELYPETFQIAERALDDFEQLLAAGRPAPGRQALVRQGLLGPHGELTPCGRTALAQRSERRGGMFVEGIPIEVISRGGVGAGPRDRFRAALHRVAARAPRPVLFVRGTLTRDQNPSLARPAVVEAAIEASGRVIRATARASELGEAIDLCVERLQRKIREYRRADAAERREPSVSAPGSWRHGDLPSHRRRAPGRRRR